MATPKYDADRNYVTVSVKRGMDITSCPQYIFSVKTVMTFGATVIFNKNKNELIHRSGTNFKIQIHNRLYYLMIADNNTEDKGIMICIHDTNIWSQHL